MNQKWSSHREHALVLLLDRAFERFLKSRYRIHIFRVVALKTVGYSLFLIALFPRTLSLIEVFSLHGPPNLQRRPLYYYLFSHSLFPYNINFPLHPEPKTPNLKPPSTSSPVMRLTTSTSLLVLFSLTDATPITATNTNNEVTRATNHGYCGWGYTLPGEKGKHVILLGDGEHHTEFVGNEGKINSVFISLTCTCQLYE